MWNRSGCPSLEEMGKQLEQQQEQWEHIKQVLSSIEPSAYIVLPEEMLEEIDEACVVRDPSIDNRSLGAIRV